MGIKRLKPTSPARRYQTYLTRDELTPNAVPEKSLLEPKKRISGRNNDGRITIRRRGGGHKRHYRIIDFKPSRMVMEHNRCIKGLRCVVEVVTDDGKKISLDVKTGDRILFGKYSGSEVTLDNEEYLILREEDVLCILE